MNLRIKLHHPLAKVPTYASDGACAFDLHAVSSVTVMGRGVTMMDTGVSVAVPEGYVLLVNSRSGHGAHYSTRLANCQGWIDCDYRGTIKVLLTCDDDEAPMLHIRVGDRIAQAMLVPAPRVAFETVGDLGDTVRGTGGLGSTGA